MKKRFLFVPVDSYQWGQAFGENQVCVAIDDKLPKYIGKRTQDQCPSGYESVYKRLKGHAAQDIRAKHGTPCRASVDGKIVFVDKRVDSSTDGLSTVIRTKDKYYCMETGNYEYFEVLDHHYAENTIVVNKGDDVRVGDLLGKVGSTGQSTGPHDHYGLTPVKENGEKLLPNNGYNGRIDPRPYMIDMPAVLYPQIKQLLQMVSKILETPNVSKQTLSMLNVFLNQLKVLINK